MTSKKELFSVQSLRKHCLTLFGVPKEVFDGALYGVTENISKKEAKKRIDSWLRKEVK